jgi:hypothetical protein
MAIEKSLGQRILRDATISVFIYALPVLLMLGWFHYKGEKPWLDKPKASAQTIIQK